MKFEYSSDIDALRIYIQEGNYDDSIEIARDLFVDIDGQKNILAFEMLDASRFLMLLDF